MKKLTDKELAIMESAPLSQSTFMMASSLSVSFFILYRSKRFLLQINYIL